MSVSVKLPGFANSLKEMQKALEHWKGKKHVTVGIHDGGLPRKDGTLNTATIGAINHFGQGRIPARPFLDNGVMSVKTIIASEASKMMRSGKTPDEILPVVGNLAVRGVVQTINNTYAPPNAPSTIAKKGSSHPLIDTGNLRQSITFKVNDGRL